MTLLFREKAPYNGTHGFRCMDTAANNRKLVCLRRIRYGPGSIGLDIGAFSVSSCWPWHVHPIVLILCFARSCCAAKRDLLYAMRLPLVTHSGIYSWASLQISSFKTVMGKKIGCEVLKGSMRRWTMCRDINNSARHTNMIGVYLSFIRATHS